MKTLIIIFLVFTSFSVFSQPTEWMVGDLDTSEDVPPQFGKSARLVKNITLNGQQLVPDEDWIGVFETDNLSNPGTGRNLVGVGIVKGSSTFSIMDVLIYETTSNRNQLSNGENFTFEIYDASEDLIIPVVIAASSRESLEVEFSKDSEGSSARMETPTQFGPFVPQPLNGNLPGWQNPITDAIFALPVTYSSISLSNNDCKQVSFDWATSSETNNEGFYVERKVEGARTWESLDFIEGNGTSYEEIDYRFVDREITDDKSLKVVYYRLKQVDYDGRIEYSDTKSVRLNCGNSTYINVFPNPASDYVKVQLNHEGLSDDDVTFEIYSMNGQLISRKVQKLTNKEIMEIQTGDFAPGIYTIQAFTNNLMISHTRFTKN